MQARDCKGLPVLPSSCAPLGFKGTTAFLRRPAPGQAQFNENTGHAQINSVSHDIKRTRARGWERL